MGSEAGLSWGQAFSCLSFMKTSLIWFWVLDTVMITLELELSQIWSRFQPSNKCLICTAVLFINFHPLLWYGGSVSGCGAFAEHVLPPETLCHISCLPNSKPEQDRWRANLPRNHQREGDGSKKLRRLHETSVLGPRLHQHPLSARGHPPLFSLPPTEEPKRQNCFELRSVDSLCNSFPADCLQSQLSPWGDEQPARNESNEIKRNW